MTEPFTDPADREDRALLGLLLDAHPAQLSANELTRQLQWPRATTDDALRRLDGDGLIHHHGPFAFATGVAVRCRDLMS